MKPLKQILSPQALRNTMHEVCSRFPFTVGATAMLAAWMILLVFHESDFDSRTILAVSWALTESVLMTLAAAIWCEYMLKERLSRPVQWAVIAFAVIDFASLMMRDGVSGNAEWIGRSAIVTALAVAVIFVPKAPGLGRKQLWAFSIGQLQAIAMGVLLSWVLSIAILIIFGTLSILFGTSNYKVPLVAYIIFSFFVPAMLALSRMPERARIAAVSDLPATSPVGAFCKNILLPLVGIYIIILYVYAAKILFKWNLPSDSISIMVTGLMCVSLILLYGLRRYIITDSVAESPRRIATIAGRLIPVLLLPLLVLMSVGVVYRVGEYGITPSRLYVIVFNIWAYAVTVCLIFRRNANLNLVAASFAIVFVLVSAIPGANLYDFAIRSIRSSVISTLNRAGVDQLPIEVGKLKEVIARMPEKEGSNLASRISYLDDWHDHSLVADIVTSSTKVTEWELRPDTTVVDGSDIIDCRYSGSVSVPSGFGTVEYFVQKELDIPVDESALSDGTAEMARPVDVALGDSVLYRITRIYRYSADRKNKLTGYKFKKNINDN